MTPKPKRPDERKLGMKKLVRRDKIPGIRFFYVIGGPAEGLEFV